MQCICKLDVQIHEMLKQYAIRERKDHRLILIGITILKMDNVLSSELIDSLAHNFNGTIKISVTEIRINYTL